MLLYGISEKVAKPDIWRKNTILTTLIETCELRNLYFHNKHTALPSKYP